MIDLIVYETKDGFQPFKKWLNSIRSKKVKSKIFTVLTRMEAGLMGDVKAVGGGVHELRLHLDQGYRIYFANDGEQLVVLLAGSDKKTQKKEILNALDYWKDYKNQKAKKAKEGEKR